MTPYKQTKTTQNGDRGNCLATSFACLFDTPIEEIPEFEEMQRTEWKPALFEWLGAKGFTLRSGQIAPEGYAIAVGWNDDGVLHAVIVKDGTFYHDPNPSNGFLVKIRDYWTLKPLYTS